MNRTPADRLRELREKRGFSTAKEAADAFGWNEVTYRSHENSTRNIPVHAARKYALAYGTSPSYILAIGGSVAEPTPNNGAVIGVPVVAKASAGAFRVDEGIEYKGIIVPAVPRPDIPGGVQYAVEVDGQSVNLRIPHGAFAICAPFDKYPGGPKHGQLVHVVREHAGLHEHTIKELHYTGAGAILMPASSDPRYQEQIALGTSDDDTVVRIQGVVIGSYTPL